MRRRGGRKTLRREALSQQVGGHGAEDGAVREQAATEDLRRVQGRDGHRGEHGGGDRACTEGDRPRGVEVARHAVAGDLEVLEDAVAEGRLQHGLQAHGAAVGVERAVERVGERLFESGEGGLASIAADLRRQQRRHRRAGAAPRDRVEWQARVPRTERDADRTEGVYADPAHRQADGIVSQPPSQAGEAGIVAQAGMVQSVAPAPFVPGARARRRRPVAFTDAHGEQGVVADVVTRPEQRDASALAHRFVEDLQASARDHVHRVAAFALAEQGLSAVDARPRARVRQREDRLVRELLEEPTPP